MRSANTARIAQLFKTLVDWDSDPYNNPDYDFAVDAVRDLLVECLSDRERQVYDYVGTQIPVWTWTGENHQFSRNITSRMVADHFQIEINNASSILKRLYSYGLITRRLVQDERGIEFLYD